MDLLYFQLDGAPYAIVLETIADVAPAGTIQPVPLAPRAVLGLAERRGRPVAVIDLRAALDERAASAPGRGHLVRLSEPLEGAALFVPAEVFSGSGTPATSEHVWIEGRLHRLLDAHAIVKRAGTVH